nr:type II toxin-antitoxin system PemK/MazF family toxin [Patulibacter americanus]
MSRGEVWWADLGESRGSAPAQRRPVLIVSADPFNASRINTVIVVALTRTLRLAALPGNVALPAELSGLPADSVANVTQVATLDRAALEVRVGALPAWTLVQVDAGLRRALGLAG